MRANYQRAAEQQTKKTLHPNHIPKIDQLSLDTNLSHFTRKHFFNSES
jgi:hypothetical protein